MERIDQVYEYEGYEIHVFKGLADINDTNWNQEIKFTISKTEKNAHGELILKPLWLFDEDEIDDPQYEYKKRYQIGDYFQQTFTITPRRKGIGSILHEFIIEKRNLFDIENVYSTNFDEDGHIISEEANGFWVNRVNLNKALEVPEFSRYKINFE